MRKFTYLPSENCQQQQQQLKQLKACLYENFRDCFFHVDPSVTLWYVSL